MNQDNNQKKVENLIDQKEEKDFLAREEIKTMQKDMSRLREIEARRERERVAKIKTEEEIVRDQERQKLAQQASLERNSAEKEAKEREERIMKMREEREVKEKTFGQAQIEKKETAAGEFRGVLRETQNKEEELRKRFLERVEARAEGKEEVSALPPLPSLPPTPPVIKERKTAEIAKALFKKPSSGQKVWIRLILSLLAVSGLALGATFLYWYFSVRPTPPPVQEPEVTTPITTNPEVKELVIPPSLFYIESSQTLKISETSEVPFLLFQALQGKTEVGSVNRVLIEDTKNIEILGAKEIFDSFDITTPEGFYEKLATSTTLFVYSQEEGNRLGMVIEITDKEGFVEMMSLWEETMEEDLKGFFELLDQTEPALYSYFRDATYQETAFRFQTFSRQDIGIVYSIFDDYFILTTSWKSMEKALDKLREAALSSFFSPEGGAEFVLEKMSARGKIGQLFFIGINGTTLTPETEKLIASVQPGGILLLKKNIVDETQTKALIQNLQRVALKNYGVPLFIGVDQEGGEISPVNFIQEKTAQSEIETADQAFAVGLGRGEELKDLGINLNLAPVLDNAQPGDFLFTRAFQSVDADPTALAKALISGQKTASILTAIKHFPGYGDIAFDPEDKLATLDQTPQISLFENAAEAKPEFIMTSNVIYTEIDPDLPFSFSPEGIALLKQSVGSEPLIMTDDLPQQSLIDKFSLKGVVTLPVKAGADVLTFSNNWETTLSEAVHILNEAVKNDEVSQDQIDDSVLKIIKLKKVYYYYE